MRYIQPPDMRKRARVYEGRRVSTTSNRTGIVKNAYVYKGVVTLYCEAPDGTNFITDNEHCSIWEPRENNS